MRLFPLLYFAHALPGERRLQEFIRRELNSNMCQTEKSRGEAGIKGRKAFRAVHLPRRINGRSVVPLVENRPCRRGIAGASKRVMMASSCVRIALRHETGLDDPDRVRDNGAAGASNYGRPKAYDMRVFCSSMESQSGKVQWQEQSMTVYPRTIILM